MAPENGWHGWPDGVVRAASACASDTADPSADAAIQSTVTTGPPAPSSSSIRANGFSRVGSSDESLSSPRMMSESDASFGMPRVASAPSARAAASQSIAPPSSAGAGSAVPGRVGCAANSASSASSGSASVNSSAGSGRPIRTSAEPADPVTGLLPEKMLDGAELSDGWSAVRSASTGSTVPARSASRSISRGVRGSANRSDPLCDCQSVASAAVPSDGTSNRSAGIGSSDTVSSNASSARPPVSVRPTPGASTRTDDESAPVSSGSLRSPRMLDASAEYAGAVP